jgi:hypothetical protein
MEHKINKIKAKKRTNGNEKTSETVATSCNEQPRTRDGQLQKWICNRIGTINSNQESTSRPMNRSGTSYRMQNNGAANKEMSWDRNMLKKFSSNQLE